MLDNSHSGSHRWERKGKNREGGEDGKDEKDGKDGKDGKECFFSNSTEPYLKPFNTDVLKAKFELNSPIPILLCAPWLKYKSTTNLPTGTIKKEETNSIKHGNKGSRASKNRDFSHRQMDISALYF